MLEPATDVTYASGMPVIHHPWDLRPKQAIALQRELAGEVIDDVPLGEISTVAGVDVAFRGDLAIAAIILLDFPALLPVDSAVVARRVSFPYIPGLLSFREGPAVMEAIDRVAHRLDLIIIDGQGRAHPRRFGIACHLGLLSGIPSIGCGRHAEPPAEKGSHVPLLDGQETIGAVVRTRDRVKPVYVSAGHLIDLRSSIRLVLSCCTKYRLPEPVRLAHHLAASAKKQTSP
jgi:deoxyribonuclease V